MPTPIFVLGLQRSGTTWLANQLAAHTDIAAVTHPRHFGVHESCFFDCVDGRYGDLSNKSNTIEFVETMLASDYFMLAGATREYLYGLWPVTYEGVFRAVMDRYATSRGSNFWVEKSPQHTLHVRRIAAFYPDARFVAIRRDLSGQLASLLAMQPSQNRMKSILGGVIRWRYYDKHLNFLEKNLPEMMVIDYHNMQRDPQRELTRVCDFLGIAFEENMLAAQFQRNTSFADDVQRGAAFSGSERWFLAGFDRAAAIIPYRAMRILHHWMKRRHRRRPLPTWFFAVTRGSNTDGDFTLQNQE